METRWEMVVPGRPNVIGLLKGEQGSKPLMFEGHTDVDAWTLGGPYSAEIVNGRLYGRGANDMKVGLVAAMCAPKGIIENGARLEGTILIGAAVGEEGRMASIKHLAEHGWADPVDAAIVCEPEENHLCIAQKGVMWLAITCPGFRARWGNPA